MMLRASIEYSGVQAEVGGITEGAKAGDLGIEHGERLTAFADAAVQGESAALDAARDALRESAGSGALVDAAAVVGNFERMVRIADGAGIPLDGTTEILTTDLRKELGLNQFSSRRKSQVGIVTRSVAPMLRGVFKPALRFLGRRARSRK